MSWPEPEHVDWRGGHPVAAECRDGCQLSQARVLYARAQTVLDNAQQLAGRTIEGKPMSQALWCDAGEHPFSARDPKAERWDRTMKNDDGETITIPWDVCSDCLQGATPGFNLKQRHAIMKGGVPGLDDDAS